MLISRNIASGGEIGYTPADPTDWDIPVPTNLAAGEDQLADRTRYLETHGTPGGSILIYEYDCPTDVAVGDAVYLSDTDEVDKASALSASTAPVIGFVLSKPSSTRARVQMNGEFTYPGGGLTEGGTYFLNHSSPPDGTIIHDEAPPWPPDPPWGHNSIVQEIGFARNATTLVIMIDRDYVTL